MNGLHSSFDIAVRRENDCGRHIARIAQLLQKPESVESGHIEVGDNDIGGKVGKFYECILAVAGRPGGHAPRGNHGGEAAALAGFVVYDENFDRLIQWRSFG